MKKIAIALALALAATALSMSLVNPVTSADCPACVSLGANP